MSALGNGVAGFVAGAADRAPQKGGVEKLPEYFNTEGLISREILGAAVEKPPGNFNKQDGFKSAHAPDLHLQAPLPEAIEPCETGQPLAMLVPATNRKGGRPSVFTADLTEQLCLLLTVGLSRNQAAAYLGIDRSSISHAVSRDPDLAAQLKQAEELADLQPELTLIAAARKNWRAAAWYLQFKKKNPRPPTAEEVEASRQSHQEFIQYLNGSMVAAGNHLEQLRQTRPDDSPADSQPRKRRPGAKRKEEA